MTTKPGHCRNHPTCPNPVRVGYCESCKALRRLLTAILHDDDLEYRGVTLAEDRDRGLSARRRGVVERRGGTGHDRG